MKLWVALPPRCKYLEQLEWRCEAWTGGRWYVLYIKNSRGWFTEGLCLQKPTHTQTKDKDNLLRRLNEVHLCQMERQEQRVSPVWLHEYAGTGVSGTRWKIQAGEVANGQFSSTQCDTYIHYACVTCITCYVLVKKATQSRAIWSSRWLIHGPLKICARVTHDWNVTCKWQLWALRTWQLFYHHSENLFPSRAGLTSFYSIAHLRDGRNRKKRRKKKENPMLSGQ